MVTKDSTPPNAELERKLEGFAEYLCARRGLAECTISDYLGTIRRLCPTGVDPVLETTS